MTLHAELGILCQGMSTISKLTEREYIYLHLVVQITGLGSLESWNMTWGESDTMSTK